MMNKRKLSFKFDKSVGVSGLISEKGRQSIINNSSSEVAFYFSYLISFIYFLITHFNLGDRLRIVGKCNCKRLSSSCKKKNNIEIVLIEKSTINNENLRR